MNDKLPILSLIVACFNDELNLPVTHNKIVDTFTAACGYQLEIIYIDDGSLDRTWDLIEEYAHYDKRIEAIRFARNFGQQSALTAGMAYANGDVIAIMDSDLQDPPEVILEMLKKWRDGYDVVYGVRKKRKENLIKRMSYFLFYRVLSKLSNISIPKDSGDFAVIDRRVVNSINSLPERIRFLRGLRAWCGFTQIAFPYERRSREIGVSYYSFSKVIKLALDGIFNFSTKPLTFISILGVTISAISISGGVFYFLAKIFNFEILGHTANELPGYTSIIISILFLSGIQLLSLGIIGEYIGRIFDEVKNRPSYIESKHLLSNYSSMVASNNRE